MLQLPTPYFICIYGPTAVGKTAFVQKLSAQLPIEVINMDMGQFYQPLSIGTAKPKWQQEPVPYHMFDILNKPDNYSVVSYRKELESLLPQIWARHKIPVLVGGSGFYLHNLLFPVEDNQITLAIKDQAQFTTQELWEQLNQIDPERALIVHVNDRYRITRALSMWQTTGKKPSELKPHYNPIAPGLIIELERERTDLYARINTRVDSMMHEGWQEEVDILKNSEWEGFIKNKGLIGYALLLKEKNKATHDLIAQYTRNYAKQQSSFGRMLERKLYALHTDKPVKNPIHYYRYNLTFMPLDLYLKQLIEWTMNNDR